MTTGQGEASSGSSAQSVTSEGGWVCPHCDGPNYGSDSQCISCGKDRELRQPEHSRQSTYSWESTLLSAVIGMLACVITNIIFLLIFSFSAGIDEELLYLLLPFGLILGIVGGEAGKKYLSERCGVWISTSLGAVVGGSLASPLIILIMFLAIFILYLLS